MWVDPISFWRLLNYRTIGGTVWSWKWRLISCIEMSVDPSKKILSTGKIPQSIDLVQYVLYSIFFVHGLPGVSNYGPCHKSKQSDTSTPKASYFWWPFLVLIRLLPADSLEKFGELGDTTPPKMRLKLIRKKTAPTFSQLYVGGQPFWEIREFSTHPSMRLRRNGSFFFWYTYN